MQGGSVVFDYTAKSGQERYVALADDLVRAAVRRPAAAPQRWAGTPCLQGRRHWQDVSSADINGYVKEQVGDEVSAKDFRTWHGTVIAAVMLAAANEKARTQSARKRAVASAMKRRGRGWSAENRSRRRYRDQRTCGRRWPR